MYQMSAFFVNKFSRAALQLLILGWAPSVCFADQLNISEENFMPPSRSELPTKDKWNVEAMYKDTATWSAALSKVQGKEGELLTFQGHLGDPKAMFTFLEQYLDLSRSLDKLITYAHLRFDEDLGNDDTKRNFGLVSTWAHEFQQQMAWVEPEILGLTDKQIQGLLKDPALQLYQFYLERILRQRPHVLSKDKEELLALSGQALEASRKAFGALNNADMEFESAVDSQGQEYPLSNGSYGTFLHSPDRTLRKSAVLNLHRGFQAHVNTICELLQGQVQAHLFNAKTRKYKDCVTAALFYNKIEPAVVQRLIETVRKGKSSMEDYLALRKEVLKLDSLHAYDLACPLVPVADVKLSYAEACQAVIESVAPLGPEYQAVLRKGLLEERWVDPFENAKKRSGAYSSGCYDSMPYILMNFHGTLSDTMTLAHEAGHSMHSYLSRKNQPYIYEGYSIFVAEIASTFNEQLLTDYLMKKAKTKQERAYLLNEQIDKIRSTIVRQTLFAEFELKIHTLAEQGQPLTPSALNKIYAGLLKDYYGADFTVDPELEVEWARIPHFYSNFYVYQYATGLSAAMALHEKALQSKEARDKYLKFLSSGGSKYPIELLKETGVDMTTSAPVEAALKRFHYLVQELKKNL
jgi:oligoendopeptidase F